jgi:cytochrome c peroxidase
MKYLIISLFVFVIARANEGLDLKKLKLNFVRPKNTIYLDSNPYSKDKEDLGKNLFFDPRLSGTSSMSCATCHNPSFSWGDALPTAVGNGQKVLARKSPTILNLAWTEKLMWDGRFKHLEGQAMGPIGSPNEMNMDVAKLADKISQIDGYKIKFKKAFGTDVVTNDLLAKALAIYERGIISADAPFDLWIKGNEKAISENAKKGFVLYNTKANCIACHSGWRFTDDSFQDVGLNSDDIGRGEYVKSLPHTFKTPGLRNISQRGPYMHNGSKKTLKEVIDFYNQGGEVKREGISDNIKPLNLSEIEKSQLIEFLNTLTSKDKEVTFPILPQRTIE